MGKELDELRREYAKNEAKLQQYQHRAKRLEQRKQYYEKGERQKHVHCLITRGATVESIVPEAVSYTHLAIPMYCLPLLSFLFPALIAYSIAPPMPMPVPIA